MNTRLLRSIVCSAVLALLLLIGSGLAGLGWAAGESGPGDALIPTGAAMTAQPGSQTWYKFDESGSGRPVTVWVEANGQSGILFRVYTPEAIARWVAGEELQAIGVSSRDPVHDQVWTGRFKTPGTYYIVVENTSAQPITYTLRITGEGVTTTTFRQPTATPFPNPFKTPVPIARLKRGKIVFQESSGGNIYTVNADGTNLRRVTFGLDPAFSPDGTKIAFARQGPIPGLYVADADGSNERLLYGANEVRSPSWSSDSTRIVFSAVTQVRPTQPICFLNRCFGGDDVVTWKLKAYDLKEDKVIDLNVPPTGGTVPSVNWKTGAIAFMNRELGLMLTSFDKDDVPRVIDNDLTINTPSFSPDGSRLTYMVRQPPVWQIVVAVWDGTHPTLLTTQDPLDFVHPDNVAPTFSPDGNEILFLSNRNGKWEFFVIQVDGRNERQVLKNVTDRLNIQYNFSAERVASWVE